MLDVLSVSGGRGRKEGITGEAKTWLISIACIKPKDLGYAAETWTTSSLKKHINKVAKDAGFDRLSTISESGVYRIFDKADMGPFRIQYYCEKREPDFDDGEVTHILSYDGILGIQAIANISDDLMPAEKNGGHQAGL